MNSLEFIEKEIEWVEHRLNVSKTRLEEAEERKDFASIEIYKKYINEFNEQLKTLQQTKTELEAWKVCKNDCVIFSVIKDLVDGKSLNWHRLSKEQQETLKKALEVKDE